MKTTYIVIAIVVVLAVIGGIYWYTSDHVLAPTTATTTPATQTAPVSTTATSTPATTGETGTVTITTTTVTTPAPQSFTVNGNDASADLTTITVPKGTPVTITFGADAVDYLSRRPRLPQLSRKHRHHYPRQYEDDNLHCYFRRSHSLRIGRQRTLRSPTRSILSSTNMNSHNTILLRIAIALAFIYPPVDAFFNPNAWISYFPSFMLNIVPNVVLLSAWGILEIIIAVWILSGKKIFLPSLAAGILLCLIVVFNIPLMEILFRDVALALVAFTLAWWSWKPKTVQ